MHLHPLDASLMAAVWSGDFAAANAWAQSHSGASADPLSANEALVAAAQLNRADITACLLGAGAFAGHKNGEAWGWAILHDNAALASAISDSLFGPPPGERPAAAQGVLGLRESEAARRRFAAWPWDPLNLALKKPSLSVVSAWKKSGLLSELPWESVSQAMSDACKGKSGEIVDFFLDCGVELWDHPRNKSTRMMAIVADIGLALENPDASALAALLRPDRARSYSGVALHIALAKANHIDPPPLDKLEIIAKAIPWGALEPSSDINHELMNCAGEEDKVASLRLMLAHGAPADGLAWRHVTGPEAKTPLPKGEARPWGKMRSGIPLFAALTSGVKAAVAALMEHGADPGLGSEPDSPISFARKIPASNRSHEAAQILIALAEQRELKAIAQAPADAPARSPRKPMSL